MKKVRKLLKEKRWRWTAGGAACVLAGALGFSMLSDVGVRADEISLGSETVDLQPVGSETGVYWVETADQLRKLGNATEGTAGLTFRLKNDITVSSVTAPAAGIFEGTFDGDGHVVIYEDVNVTMADEIPSNTSVSNGLLFGNVRGTVQNLIVDIADEDASYTRKTKSPAKETIAVPIYESVQNPIIGEGEVVSGLSFDSAVLDKVKAIFALEADSVTGNKVHTLQEKGTQTRTYATEDLSEDYFGLICGMVSGTVQEVYLTGNEVSIGREELTTLDYSKSVQSGYREETYYYSQEIDSETEEAVPANLSIAGTVYAEDKIYTEKLESDKLSLTVWAAKAAVRGESITYKVKINNESEADYTGVTVAASENGTWSDTFPLDIAAGDSADVEFYYNTETTSVNELSLDFTVTGTTGNVTALATVPEVKTQLLEQAGEAEHKSKQGLELRVLAPQVVEYGKDVVYQVTVTNRGTAEYSNVELQAAKEGTWNTESTFSLTAGGYKNLTFTLPGENVTEENVTIDFGASAINAGTLEKAKAVVSDISTQVVQTSMVSEEVSLEGLRVKIEAPAAKDTSSGGKAIIYKVTVFNESDQVCEKVTLTSSVKGRWSTQNGTSYDLTNIPANGSKQVNFVYTYQDADLTTGKIAIDFEAMKETEGQSVELTLDDSEVKLFNSEEIFPTVSSQGLELKVQGPQSAAKGSSIAYKVTVRNLSGEAYEAVQFTSDKGGTWSQSSVSLAKDASETVTFTYTPSDTETLVSPKFTATAGDLVAVTVANAETTIFDTAETNKYNSKQSLKMTVFAPQAVEKGNNVDFKVKVENVGEESYSNVKVQATGNGTWSNDAAFELASAAAPKELIYTCATSGETDEVVIDFSLSGTPVAEEGGTGDGDEQLTAESITVEVPAVTISVYDTSDFSEKIQKEGLEIEVSAPRAAQKGENIVYNVTVNNTSTNNYTGVEVTASSGTWNSVKSVNVAAGKKGKVTFELPTTADSSDEIMASFTVVASTAIKVNVPDVKTKLFSTANAAMEELVEGLILSVSAPDKKGAGEEKTIRYELKLTNTSQKDYLDLKLTSSKAGTWNSGNTGASFTIAKLESGDFTDIIFEYDYTEEDAASNMVSVDFEVSGNTDAATAAIHVSGVETELVDVSGTSEAVSLQGLQLSVKAPKEAAQKSELVYRVSLANMSNATIPEVSLSASESGNWSDSTSFPMTAGEVKELTFTFMAGEGSEAVIEFTAEGKNSTTSEEVTAKASGVTTKLFDAEAVSKVQTIPGMEVKILSAQAQKIDGDQKLTYEMTVTNTSGTEYTNVILHTSKAGAWNGAEEQKDSYEIGTLASGASQTVTLVCTYTEEESQMGEAVLDCSVTGKAEGAQSELKIEDITTKLLKVVADSKTVESSNGLKATLEVENSQLMEGESFRYTLTLENTNTLSESFILAKDLKILTDFSEKGWNLESTTASDFALGTDTQVLPAGTQAVLKKTVSGTVSGSGVSNVQIESLTLESALASQAYQYAYDQVNSVPENGEFYADDTAPVTSGSAIIAGNVLYAGGVAGNSSGIITKVKQSVDLTGSEADGKFAIGGIGGKKETTGDWSAIYMAGTVNGVSRYDASGSVSPKNSAKTEEEANQAAENNDSWASYTKYTKTDSELATQNFGELSWLVKAENDTDMYFAYAEPVGDAITVSVEEGKKLTSKELSYIVAYNARRSMNDLTESSVYVSGNGIMELGESGYYRLLGVYATDGYYHYCAPTVPLNEAEWRYPYCENTQQNPYAISEQKVVRSSTNPLEDKVQITFGSAMEGEVYYDITFADVIPNLGTDTTTEHAALNSEGSVELPFTLDTVRYRIVPIVGGHIYPTQTTKEFSQNDKQPLPKPKVVCYDYYDKNGNKKEYIALGEGPYEAGTDMLIVPGEDQTNDESYGFRYFYSTMVPDGGWDANGRYTSADVSFMNEASEYTDSAVIPEKLEGEETVYLYTEVSKKNYVSQIYCFGPFAVTNGDQLTATLTSNGKVMDGYVALDGDILTLSGAPENTSIEYMVSTKPEPTEQWNDYPAEGITMEQDAGGYIFARIKYSDTKYSKEFLFEYSFGGICADPRVTPNTGVSSAGEGAAATVGAATTVTLASRTSEAEIFYMVSNSSQNFTMERATELPSDVTEDGTVSSDNHKYFKVGSRWYRTAFTEAERYSEGIRLSHQKKEAQLLYVSAVAMAEGYEPSAVLEYVYKVQPVQQVSNPEAAFETRHMPGGEEVEVSSVAKGAAVSFFSVTPEAQLYYAVGSGTESPTIPVPEDGILVEGNFGNNFVVRLQAKKDGMLDSEIVTFVYVISDQEMASAPTATPGTTEDVPTTVIPGNKILLSTVTKEALIYYTTDGSSPKVKENEDGTFEAGNKATKLYDPNAGIVMPLEGNGYFSITAVAVKTGLAKSPEVHLIYIYPGAVLKPYANIDSGKVELNTEVILKNLTEDAVIYYEAAYGDQVPKEPTLSSSVFSEEYPFTITQKTTIKAMAAKDGVKSEVASFTYEPMSRLAVPEASIESGSVVSRGTVLELKAEEGATVYYTMDGSDPTDSANGAVISGNTLTLNGDAGSQITIKAYAQAADKSQSEVVTFTYQFSQNVGGVTASIETGSLVSNGTKVNLMSDVTDAEIYYTTDGSSPAEHGKKGTVIEINGTPGSSYTIKAVAVVNGEPGMMATFIYRIKERPAAPTASPSGGTLTIATRVSLNAGTETIYYTTDGTEPTKSSALYAEPILINRTTILKAIAVSEDGEISEVATFVYTAAEKAATVTSTKEDGTTLQPGEEISLATSTEDAVIYYSTDGTEPTLDNLDHMLVYDGESIEINRSVIIQAVAYREDLQLSDVAVWSYTVDLIPAVQQKKADEAKKAEEGLRDTDASALERDTDISGELHTRMLRENVNNTRVSYPENAMPEQLELETIKEENSPLAIEKVKGIFGEENTVLETYEFKVKKGTTIVQPKENVEIAMPIPKGYEDAALTIAYLEEGHNLKTLETRREIGMLYAKTMKLGSYVIIGPERENALDNEFPFLLLLEVTAGLTLCVGVIYYVKEKIKKRSKKG